MAALLSGNLVSIEFIEQSLIPSLTPDRRARVVARASRLRKRLGDGLRVVGPASGARAVLDALAVPLAEALGYDAGAFLAAPPHGVTAVLSCGGRPVALLLATPWEASIEALWRQAIRAGLARGTRWCLATNGVRLRLFDAATTWTRRHLEADLAMVAMQADVAIAVAALADAQALGGTGNGGALLEAAIAASDAHGVMVSRALRQGVLDALGHLTASLAHSAGARTGRASRAFEQALVIVYRLLFLLFAESRGLVPTWHRVYRDRYTVEALARRVACRPTAAGIWDTVRAISRMAHSGCEAGDLRVTAFNGRLFAPGAAPLVERARLPDRIVAHVVTALTSVSAGAAGRRRIAYADLGVEQLGAVYEEVLEWEPGAERQPALHRTSSDRRRTGSFYTPRAITDFLVRRTLAPIVEGRTPDQILGLRVLDPAMGSGAFLVSACRFLSDAIVAAGRTYGSMPSEDPAAIRRLVAQRCLYGVDLNPTAVQLARLSLWLATLASDRPLTFLDHHLAAGDSLVGAGFADLARMAPGARAPRAQPLPLFEEGVAGPLAGTVLPERFRMASVPDDVPRVVRDKERALARLEAPGSTLAAWRALADVWCAGWFVDPKPDARLFAELRAAVLAGGRVLPEHLTRPWFTRAAGAAARHRFLHWELAFPEVFFGPDGQRRPDAGFDAVIGNPPWDVMRADTGDPQMRRQDRARLARALRFHRDTARHLPAAAGHANRYQLFVERALHLGVPGGRIGLIVPSGLAMDRSSAALRRRLFDRACLDSVIGFDNRDAIFPIHRSTRFLVFTATVGAPTTSFAAAFRLRSPAGLDRIPGRPSEDPPGMLPLRLSRAIVERLDPEHQAIPDLASPEDLALLLHLVRAAPPVADRHGWGASFGRELNATDDRHHFTPRPADGRRGWIPVLEGKLVDPFRVSVDRATMGIAPGVAGRIIDRERTWGRARVAYRDVASASNRLTLIAARLPSGTLSTHTLCCLRTALPEEDEWCLLAILNSFVANYVVRAFVNTHVTAAIVGRVPAPRPDAGSPAHRALALGARRLARTGIEAGRREYVELQAGVAALYGLTTAQFAHLLATFPLVDAGVRQDTMDAFARLIV